MCGNTHYAYVSSILVFKTVQMLYYVNLNFKKGFTKIAAC